MLNFKNNKLLITIFSLWIATLPGLIVATDEATKPQTISSLQWGEILFSYFRGDKMDALVRLYARESRNQLNDHQSDANLLAAGLLLDLGLPENAQKRLQQIDQSLLNNRLKSRLSLAMARVYFQSRDVQSVNYWLEKVDGTLLKPLENTHYKMMQAQLLFSTGEFELAAKQLETIQEKSNLQVYAYYNNGLSLLQLPDVASQNQGRALLNRISIMKPVDQEQYALIDQAKIALGLDALNAEQTAEARNYLTSIRLDGMVSKDALLLLGWTYARSTQFEEALTYWLKLAETNELLEPTVQEAWLAVPYAYQQLGDLNRAVKGYELAVQQQVKAKKQLSVLLENSAWMEMLKDENSQITPGLPKQFSRQLSADPEFYHFLTKWRELEQLHSHLLERLSFLPSIDAFLTENINKYTLTSKQIKEKIASIETHLYDEKYAQLQQKFEAQQSKEFADAVLTEEDHNLWKKLQKVDSGINVLAAETLAEKKEQLRRLMGVAKWRFQRKRDRDMWTTKNNLIQLEQSLLQLHQQLATLEGRVNYPPRSLHGEKSRINQLEQRGQQLTQQIVALQRDLESSMSIAFSNFVNRRQEALTVLAEQANIALARLQFKAIRESLNDNS
ncbi:MAG: hypothetical protein GY781_05585 [Gammaproteobacteria bacterium]|nr:hypothetical protein [Gammaproteobacteria bacterium]